MARRFTQAKSLRTHYQRLQRGRTLYGLTRDELGEVMSGQGCKWWIQDGVVEMVPETSYIPEPPILLTPATGLIGVPEFTQNGLRLRCLLNPNIKIGRTVLLDSTVVNQYRYGLDLQSTGVNFLLANTTTKPDQRGLYYTMRVDHPGDTRGNAWYSELTCFATDLTLTGKIADAAIAPPFPAPRDAIVKY